MQILFWYSFGKCDLLLVNDLSKKCLSLSESTTGEVDCAPLPRFNFPIILCAETGEA